MSNPHLPIKMSERELANARPTEDEESKNLNDYLNTQLRSIDTKCDLRLTDALIENISANLAIGVPFEACCQNAGVLPSTVKRWLKKGREEIENLTEEQLESDDPRQYLTNYGKFVLRMNKSKSNMVVKITEAITEKMLEPHNEWLLTWMLEKLEPETYNIKYKTAIQQNNNVNNGVQNNITVQFINGFSGRSEEDQKYIADTLNALSDHYKDQIDPEKIKNITNGRSTYE